MKLQVLAPDPFAFRPMTRIALIIANVGTLDFYRFRRECERSARGRPGRNAGQSEMAVHINSLWELRDENRWLDALNRYWVDPTVSKNRDTEQFVDKVELEYIQRLDTQEWYDFLNQYFRWRFMRSHLNERLLGLDKNSVEHLFSVKRSLAAIDELDRADSRKCLNPVKSPR
jgi:hypothetical protein